MKLSNNQTSHKTISGKNLIYIAEERAFMPNIAKGWYKTIPAPHTKHGRLFGINVSDKLMKLIEIEKERK